MPQISVVLPVYNGAATLVRATRSILEQSFDDLELIVIDDGSTDETLERLHSVRDPRLSVLDLPHRGVVAAANRGTEVATAPIIARMDADDERDPKRLELQLGALREDPQLALVGCQVPPKRRPSLRGLPRPRRLAVQGTLWSAACRQAACAARQAAEFEP